MSDGTRLSLLALSLTFSVSALVIAAWAAREAHLARAKSQASLRVVRDTLDSVCAGVEHMLRLSALPDVEPKGTLVSQDVDRSRFH